MPDSTRRTIFLVDMNAFFISCEAARNPKLKSRPAAVAGDPQRRAGIILAANYEARAYGVKTTMLVHEAKRLCPDIILLPPDHRYYEKMSKEVMKILSDFTPVIQQNSIDEAWLDLTGCEDLFGEPVKIAGLIMSRINDELDLWCSIGISENKFLSKMASEMKKPRGITELWVKDVKEKLWPLEIRKMYGIGSQTEKKLNELGILTIGDLANFDRRVLYKHFGKYAQELHEYANGIDKSPVTPGRRSEVKSISRSTTLSKDITDIESAKAVLLALSEEIGEEARRYGFSGRTVSIVIRYNDFITVTRQKSVAPTFLTRDIYKTACALLSENWTARRPIRLLGVGLSGFDEGGHEQLSFFDLDEKLSDEKKKEELLEKTIDSIRAKYGSDIVKRAKLLE